MAAPAGTPAMTPITEKIWFNAIWFQLTWFCAVLGRETLLPLTLGMLALHFVLVRERVAELRALFPLVLAGIAVDSLLSLAGVYEFTSWTPIPLWLCCLWVAFATTLNRSLNFLRRSPWLAAALGTIAPLNYLAGERLGAVEFGYPPLTTFALLAPVWAALLPLMCYMTDKLRQPREVTP